MLTREWAKTNPRLGSLPTSASAGMSSCGPPGLRVSGPYLENKGHSELFQPSTASPCLRRGPLLRGPSVQLWARTGALAARGGRPSLTADRQRLLRARSRPRELGRPLASLHSALRQPASCTAMASSFPFSAGEKQAIFSYEGSETSRRF